MLSRPLRHLHSRSFKISRGTYYTFSLKRMALKSWYVYRPVRQGWSEQFVKKDAISWWDSGAQSQKAILETCELKPSSWQCASRWAGLRVKELACFNFVTALCVL